MRKFENLTKKELLTIKQALGLSREAFITKAESFEKPNKFWLELICIRGGLIADVTAELHRGGGK